MSPFVMDLARLEGDKEYRDELRHRCITDGFFLAPLLGYFDFDPSIHQVVKELYVAKKPGLSIPEQDTEVKHRMHLDPRHTFKTTYGIVDTIQWILACPNITIVNETATQPLGVALTKVAAKKFYKPKTKPPTEFQLLFPEYVVTTPIKSDYRAPCATRDEVEATLYATSVGSSQTGFHPWLINPDDMVDLGNSGLDATDDSRTRVWNTYSTNGETLRHGGYTHVRGTRYHPFDAYGMMLKTMDPSKWKTLIRSSLTVASGRRLVEGEFPSREEVELNFPTLLDYATLATKFRTDYRTFMCFCEGSRVLMADWTEKPIEQIKVGDIVMGFEKNGPRNTCFVKTKVVRLFSRTAKAIDLKTKCGRSVHTTKDHRFLQPGNGGELRYVEPKIGGKLVSVYKPSAAPDSTEQRLLDWLGGLLDGEGSISKAGVHLSQKKSKNPEIYAAITQTLEVLGIKFGLTKTHETDRFSLEGGRSTLIRLLQYAQMAKRSRIIKTLESSLQLAESCGRRGGETYPVVESMASLGDRKVYDFETETHNFICEGFAVHNCQQQNDPQGGGVALFPAERFLQSQMTDERIPSIGEIRIAWRLDCTAKHFMKYAEGVCCLYIGSRVYQIDAWRGIYTPTELAERIVDGARRRQCGDVAIEQTPGSDSMIPHIQNEAVRRNWSLRIERPEFENDDATRIGRMKQLEPMMQSGRLWFSTGSGQVDAIKEQFTHFGLIDQNGLVDCTARLALRLPVSVLKNEVTAEQRAMFKEAQGQGIWNMIYGAGGAVQVEESIRTEMAMQGQDHNSYGLTAILGGLDG